MTEDQCQGSGKTREAHEVANFAGADGDDDYESLLWLLSDSNLPTGGFVASAGLESFFAHGYLHDVSIPSVAESSAVTTNQDISAKSQADQVSASTASFLYLSLSSYARTALPFILDVHRVVSQFLQAGDEGDNDHVNQCMQSIIRLDDAYHTMTLNHVLRRASKAQGIALLTLYAKSFAGGENEAIPLGRRTLHAIETESNGSTRRASKLISDLKRRIRVASVKDEPPHGHLPICWAVFCAALAIPIQATIKLHLFLQGRAILSSSIRLNTVGPYLAHSMLHRQVRRVLAEILHSKAWMQDATSGLGPVPSEDSEAETAPATAFQWDWPEEGSWHDDERARTNAISPANTWPLGEIVQARHDSLHSRLFNS